METITIQNRNEDEREKAAERMRFVEKIYGAALAEHAQFREIPESNIKEVILTALEEIEKLEKAANPKNTLAALTPEVAKKISTLWVFSGPGTYDDPIKEDRYKKYLWAKGMDRTRLSYTAWLARKISETVSGETLHGPINEIPERIQKDKKLIAENSPTILYNGTELENSVVKDVLTREGIIIPPEKIRIIGEGIDSTVDQVKTFKLPEELHRPGGEIGLVSYAPHLMRIIHMLSQYNSLPEDMTVRLFPIATPREGKEEYSTLEIKGLLYYVFLGKNAQVVAYPSVIRGERI